MPVGEAWLVFWLTFNCPWVLDKVPFALKPLACATGAELEVRIVSSKEEAQHVLGKMPENPDFAWVFKVDKGRIATRRIRRVPVVDP